MIQHSEFSCIICQQSSPIYKCPHCKCRYCSLQCYKVHKLTCTNSPLESPLPSESPPISQEMIYRCTKPRNSQKEREFSELTEEQKKLLLSSSSIMKALGEPGIESLIKDVLKSHTPDDTLDALIDRYPEFNEFLNLLLDTVQFHPTRESRTLHPRSLPQWVEKLAGQTFQD
ncbi:putative zinc finger HIT domain-containing protein 3 [Blattamonas nauphoetae]|uniref:Zinc finger HIT domain-containing protein 3 n=1 Tax=Blattamonas nauphoetae TaxID=2049346 RepID=A0ABQ9YF72_9EUKA|nr:putative zinc finger HIT domain-containing protein 3 [Blattamonas nauphoetae]